MSPVANRGDKPQCALVLSGGGALAAYQVGVVSWLARHGDDCVPSVITGVSAGAINAAALACYPGSFPQRADRLREAWRELSTDKVFRVDAWSLVGRLLGWGLRLASGGRRRGPHPRGLVDTAPLRGFLREQFAAAQGRLTGIDARLEDGTLEALAITASSYATGQSVTWTEGRQPTTWSRAHRVAQPTRLTIEHVMASAALPLLFPAIDVDGSWFCDGGVRLTSPLSPAIHLGAERILAIATRRSSAGEPEPRAVGYPPPALVVGDLLDALFLDVFDGDALRVERINALVDELPEERRHGMRRIELLVLRPSSDLSEIANDYEARLPRLFRFLIRGLGTREASRNHLLSLLMFQTDYLCRLMDLGYADAQARGAEIEAFLGKSAART